MTGRPQVPGVSGPAASASDRPPSSAGGERTAAFAELLATAITDDDIRAQVTRLAEEQAALRRVAMIVARESSPVEVFAAVTDEMARVVGAESIGLLRFEPDGTATLVGQSRTPWEPPPLGTRFTLEGENVLAEVLRTGQAARFDDWENASGPVAAMARTLGIRSSVATPIVVGARLWGTMSAVTSQSEPLPPDTKSRLGEFTELVATAIANTEARAEVRRLAEEQAALRRVATLVAEGAAPTDVFESVIVEVAQLLGAGQVGLARYEDENEISVLAIRGHDPELVGAGTRLPLDGDNVNARILRTGRSVRLNFSEEGSGRIADILRRDNVNATVGAPIVVEGTLWGIIAASWKALASPPMDAEERLVRFAGLLGTAIANADSRDQLAASRARVLAAGDEARRRLVRDLHDGAQQRLVNTIVRLKLAQRSLREDTDRTASLLAQALDHAEQGNAELRELAHGILPSLLSDGGLRAGLDSLVARLDLPVDVNVTSMRLRPEIEANAYFIVAEALTNVVKHSQARTAEVTATIENRMLFLRVRDDGVGGADPNGHGLLGISDRVAALEGQLRVDSSRGRGTVVAAQLPL